MPLSDEAETETFRHAMDAMAHRTGTPSLALLGKTFGDLWKDVHNGRFKPDEFDKALKKWRNRPADPRPKLPPGVPFVSETIDIEYLDIAHSKPLFNPLDPPKKGGKKGGQKGSKKAAERRLLDSTVELHKLQEHLKSIDRMENEFQDKYEDTKANRQPGRLEPRSGSECNACPSDSDDWPCSWISLHPMTFPKAFLFDADGVMYGLEPPYSDVDTMLLVHAHMIDRGAQSIDWHAVKSLIYNAPKGSQYVKDGAYVLKGPDGQAFAWWMYDRNPFD